MWCGGEGVAKIIQEMVNKRRASNEKRGMWKRRK
jgi:hypothetical protein